MGNLYTSTTFMEHNSHPDYKYEMDAPTHEHYVASIMDMDGVCIRAGHHCAQPLLTWLGVENLACCRASVAFYNDKADIDKFIAGLHHVWSTFNG